MPYANPAFRLQGGGLLFCSQLLQPWEKYRWNVTLCPTVTIWGFGSRSRSDMGTSSLNPPGTNGLVYPLSFCRSHLIWAPSPKVLSLYAPSYVGWACPHPWLCASSVLSGIRKGLDSAAVLSTGVCGCIPLLLENPQQAWSSLCFLLQPFPWEDPSCWWAGPAV